MKEFVKQGSNRLKFLDNEIKEFQGFIDTAKKKGWNSFKATVGKETKRFTIPEAENHLKNLKVNSVWTKENLINETMPKLMAAKIWESIFTPINEHTVSDFANNAGEKIVDLLFHVKDYKDLPTATKEILKGTAEVVGQTAEQLFQRGKDRFFHEIVKELITILASPKVSSKIPNVDEAKAAINVIKMLLSSGSFDECVNKVVPAVAEAAVQVGLYIVLNSLLPGSPFINGLLQGAITKFAKILAEELKKKNKVEEKKPDDKPTDYIITTPSSTPIRMESASSMKGPVLCPGSEWSLPGLQKEHPGTTKILPGVKQEHPGATQILPGVEQKFPGATKVILPGVKQEHPGATRILPDADWKDPRILLFAGTSNNNNQANRPTGTQSPSEQKSHPIYAEGSKSNVSGERFDIPTAPSTPSTNIPQPFKTFSFQIRSPSKHSSATRTKTLSFCRNF